LIDLRCRFEKLFGGTPRIFRAPGRVNLIGEHTDYNDGFVMPVAIHLSTWVAIAPEPDGKFVAHSENFSQTADLGGTDVSWSPYVFGVVRLLERIGHRLGGANLLIYSDLPIGAGLSSSAALEVAVGYALLRISGTELNLTDLAHVCQSAEHEFAGVRCGIMDQMIVCHGRAQHAMMLDTRSLEYEFLPLPRNVRVVVCNTMVKHNLAAGEYNDRRSECESATRTLGRSLRDVTLPDLGNLPEKISRRARHVVTENARVQFAAAALKRNDLGAFGRLMHESHRSLRDDYEVSCRELDVMVEIASGLDGVYGARMTGGGFGGCTVNLVDANCVESFRKSVVERYRKAMGAHPEVYVCSVGSGVEEVLYDAKQDSR
jgi:galactokinase